MRKTLFFIILFCLSFILGLSFTNNVKAASLEAIYKFDKLYSIEGGHTLAYYQQYRPNDVNEALKSVKKTKFMGKRVNSLSDGTLVRFRKQIIQRFVNEGESALQYKLEFKEEKSMKFIFGLNRSSQKGIEFSMKQPSIKASHATKLGFDAKTEVQTKKSDSKIVEAKLAPNKMLTHSLDGTGAICSGAAAYYIFWVRSWYGVYEYMRIDSIYHNMEIVEIKL